MKKLFGYDSGFARIMTKIGDLVLLSLLWLLASLPVITVGASTCALYSVCYRLHGQEQTQLWSAFWKAFRRDFRQATAAWVGIALAGAGLSFFLAYLIYTQERSPFSWCAFAALAVFCLIPMTHLLPLLARFENSLKAAFRNSYILYLSSLPRSLLATVLGLLPISMLLSARLLVCTVILWVMIGSGGLAYLNAGNELHIFNAYLAKHSKTEVP